MSNTNTGGPAFPQQGFDVIAERFTSQGGMTLRDYFAAKAMTGICSDGLQDSSYCNYAAKRAYEMADAMIEARESC